MGLKKFVEFSHPTYRDVTREFLATVTLSYPKTKAAKVKDGILAFTVGGKSYNLSNEEFCDILGF